MFCDVNTIIDLEVADLVPRLFQLSGPLVMSDVMYFQELHEASHDLLELGLGCVSASAEQMAKANRLRMESQGMLSVNDALMLVLTQSHQGVLLIGDGALRPVALDLGVPVKGALWVLEALWDGGSLTYRELRAALDRMRSAGRRLPWEVASDLFSTLGGLRECEVYSSHGFPNRHLTFDLPMR